MHGLVGSLRGVGRSLAKGGGSDGSISKEKFHLFLAFPGNIPKAINVKAQREKAGGGGKGRKGRKERNTRKEIWERREGRLRYKNKGFEMKVRGGKRRDCERKVKKRVEKR